MQVGAAPAQPLLWRIEGEPDSYLFGTVHIYDPRLADLHPLVVEAMVRSDGYFAEVDLGPETMGALMRYMSEPTEERVVRLLPEATRQRAQAELDRIRPGLSLDNFRGFRIWAFAVTLLTLEQQLRYPGGEALDLQLFQMAQQMGLATGGLETIEEQLRLFDSLSTEDWVRLLDDTLTFMEQQRASGRAWSEDLVQAYLSGDSAQVASFLNVVGSQTTEPELQARFMKLLIEDRDALLAARMMEKLEKGRGLGFFFAMGAAHLDPDKGVVAYLRQAGYTVERVEVPAETSVAP